MLGQTANRAASLPAAAGTPSLPVLQPASQPPYAHVTFRCLACSLQNIEDNFSELLKRLQEKQNAGQGRPDLRTETRVTTEQGKRFFAVS